jgi:hypothetical protein
VPRPSSVTLLALLVLLLSVFNLLGAISAAQRYTVLSQLPLSLPAAYLLLKSLVWAVVFAALAVGLWRLREWARRGTLAAASLYVALGWAERLLFAQSDYARTSLPFFLVFQSLWLLWVWVTLLRRSARQRFSA